jgi:hypothetical protein
VCVVLQLNSLIYYVDMALGQPGFEVVRPLANGLHGRLNKASIWQQAEGWL